MFTVLKRLLLFTSDALPEDMAKFIVCGANKVLTKPLTKAKLFDALAIV